MSTRNMPNLNRLPLQAPCLRLILKIPVNPLQKLMKKWKWPWDRYRIGGGVLNLIRNAADSNE